MKIKKGITVNELIKALEKGRHIVGKGDKTIELKMNKKLQAKAIEDYKYIKVLTDLGVRQL